jgi:hypothetical protein
VFGYRHRLRASCWSGAGFLFRAAMVVPASLFTVVQPLVIYGRARKQLTGARNGEIGLLFDEAGLTVTAARRIRRTGCGQLKQVKVRLRGWPPWLYSAEPGAFKDTEGIFGVL